MSAQQQAAAAATQTGQQANPALPAGCGDGKVFMHVAREPVRIKEEFANFVYFGVCDPPNHHGIDTSIIEGYFQAPPGIGQRIAVELSRQCGISHVNLACHIWADLHLASTHLALTADDCRELACALLDAEAHLRANPGPWEPPAADAASAAKAEGAQA